MSIDNIIKKIIKKSILIPLIPFACAAKTPTFEITTPFSERNQETIATILADIDRNFPMYTRWGVLSTALSNPVRVSEKNKEGYRHIKFHLPYNVHVSALVKRVDPSQPYILTTHGFLADKESQPARNFLKVAQRYLEGYNIIVIDHPTSAPFFVNNKEPSLGGIEEGYILTKIAKQLRKYYHATSVHLVGISMGGLGVIHAAFQGTGIIDSALAISPVTDLLNTPTSALQSLEKDGTCGRRFFSAATLNNQIGLQGLLPAFFEEIEKASRNGKFSMYDRFHPSRFDIHDADLCDFYMNTERYKNKVYVRQLYAPYIAQKILPDKLPETVQEYLSQSNASLVAAAIKVPLYVIHAYDDPAVAPYHYYNFVLAARDNSFVAGQIYPNGGHNGFSAAYGKKWVGCLIKTYVDYWSKEDALIDDSCF